MNELTYIAHKITQLVEPSIFKIVLAGLLSVGFFLFGSLYTQALMGVMMLMIFDTILGVWAVYREACKTLPKKYKKCLPITKFVLLVQSGNITSRKFSRVVSKGIVYFMAISAGYFADLTVPFNAIQGTMVAFVGVTEFISILENVGKLGFETPTKLLERMKLYRDNQ